MCSLSENDSRRHDELRKQIFNLKMDIFENSCSPSDMLRKSIKLHSLMMMAGLSLEYQLDAVFLSFEASKLLKNDKSINHWSSLGVNIASIVRGEDSSYVKYFKRI